MASNDPELVFVHTVALPPTSRSLSPLSELEGDIPVPPPEPLASGSESRPTTSPYALRTRRIANDEEVLPAVSQPKLHEFRGTVDTVNCEWNDCGIVFGHLPTFIDHIQNSKLILAPTNRLILANGRALMCGLIPEKGHTFAPMQNATRHLHALTLLQSHMRQQHGVAASLPGRSNKRKRAMEELEMQPVQPTSEPATTTASQVTKKPRRGGMRKPKGPVLAPPPPPPAPVKLIIPPPRQPHEWDYESEPERPYSPKSPTTPPRLEEDNEDDDLRFSIENLPPHIRARVDPVDGQIDGQYSAPKVMYLILKAKHRYALQHQEQLKSELNSIRDELRYYKSEKEIALNNLMRGYIGPRSEILIEPIYIPEPVQRPPSPPPKETNDITEAIPTVAAPPLDPQTNKPYRIRLIPPKAQ
ncbi:C2H2-type domain-containing protein [Mycena indigotica]|uniref:C2H2-type domain-containing protein n=1 Tax=Mycena indigotica TaxID=2126181 RepID=A0A8H6SLJ6_9AGAR|nr:C2H2-type domain-containing protein [Mycena indigotica]KAF7301985.1 C2H2-type domain-containing protein [Mycena indigotica]